MPSAAPLVSVQRLSISAANLRSASNGGALGFGYSDVSLYRPDGSYFGYFSAASSDAYGELSTLDVNDTWTAQVDPGVDSVGSLTMTLSLVTDQTGTITLGTR